jgi:hypothetical protein
MDGLSFFVAFEGWCNTVELANRQRRLEQRIRVKQEGLRFEGEVSRTLSSVFMSNHCNCVNLYGLCFSSHIFLNGWNHGMSLMMYPFGYTRRSMNRDTRNHPRYPTLVY